MLSIKNTGPRMEPCGHPASRASFISFCFNSYYTEKEALHKSALSFEVAVAPILGLVIPVYRGQTTLVPSVFVPFDQRSGTKDPGKIRF